MGNTITETRFELPGQTSFYRGKVRDVYFLDKQIVLIATDRISAFDVILPRAIPYKGQVLSQIAFEFLNATADIVPNWVTGMPDPNAMLGFNCKPYPIEMVIRGYLAGHAWREYRDGKRSLCGVSLPEGLKENDPLPQPIITPATKAQEGHDEDISREEIISRGLVPEEHYKRLEDYTYRLYEKGSNIARNRGLILVDTKYEFGTFDDSIHLIDEIHTPDSSRYFYAEGYEERQAKGEAQKQLSKEFVRQWLISQGFQGKEGQQMPEMTDEVVNSISERYIELYEKVTGKNFVREKTDNILNRIQQNIINAL
ncbi:phosphoribosylaminoimidazole-succinocarboxamide synthase [Catalinimonas alkaloidigena]|uniref:phosphoribosylaminoimidazolesuccinocarboxamide synthase n=1 Tax=Catalinimonas alkaloidigena TaxID=1075417 RepID=UPI00240656C8|nr:phosphoribosylaminoimidazolesuccinocarboxamide synthase [Catalinimonas alkaloidigena]MDF9794857.1 phosphoribosylaminoimidazole-succinocarboxamide synthase [Catalinimonas alkaloidigena]